MIAWLDGTLAPLSALRIDPADRGFLLGDGVFETMRLAGGAPAHLGRHLARLRDGAAMLGIPVPLGDEAIADAIRATAGANGIAAGSARLTLSRGPAPRGVLPPEDTAPTMLVTTAPQAASLPPARLCIALTTRRNEHSPLARIKSLNYGDAIIARREAAARGFDDAILLNTAGNIAECTAATLFLVVDGSMLTPPLADGPLPGIARALLIERCGVSVASIGPDLLAQADAAFLGNALGLRAVAAIGDRIFEAAHPAFARLERALAEEVPA